MEMNPTVYIERCKRHLRQSIKALDSSPKQSTPFRQGPSTPRSLLRAQPSRHSAIVPWPLITAGPDHNHLQKSSTELRLVQSRTFARLMTRNVPSFPAIYRSKGDHSVNSNATCNLLLLWAKLSSSQWFSLCCVADSRQEYSRRKGIEKDRW